MGKFIVIDGVDGSGKETQTLLLQQYLTNMGKQCRVLSFPRYDSKSSTLVQMYLNGELGQNAGDTNAYAASVFFACDRYISFRQEWQDSYNNSDEIIIANRYTTANAVHQMSKLPREDWDEFLTWLWDFEYKKLGIPTPDKIIYLEMLPEISIKLINFRSDKTGREKDIHELDRDFLYRSYEAALYASDKLGWDKIKCYDEKEPLPRKEIHKNIVVALHNIIK